MKQTLRSSSDTGFLEKAPGQNSMMRLLLFISTVICGLVSLWAMFEIHRVVTAVIRGNVDAASMVGTLGLIIAGALGVIAGGEGFKALQHKSEVKENNGE